MLALAEKEVGGEFWKVKFLDLYRGTYWEMENGHGSG